MVVIVVYSKLATYATIVNIIFRKINEDVGMAKVQKTLETRWWYICRQFRDDGKKQSV